MKRAALITMLGTCFAVAVTFAQDAYEKKLDKDFETLFPDQAPRKTTTPSATSSKNPAFDKLMAKEEQPARGGSKPSHPARREKPRGQQQLTTGWNARRGSALLQTRSANCMLPERPSVTNPD
jgi:hypothetical protein